jgi:hypothetical protein
LGITKDDIVDALINYKELNDEREMCWLAVANQLGVWSLGDRVFYALDVDRDGIVSLGDISEFSGEDTTSIDPTTWFSYSQVIAALLLRLASTDDNVQKIIEQAAPYAFDAARAHLEMEYHQFYSLLRNRMIPAARDLTNSS